MKTSWILGVVFLVCMGGLALAREGVVKTKDGRRFAGDITDRGEEGAVVVTRIGTLTIGRVDIAAIEYTDNIDEQYKKKLASLPKVPEPRDHFEIGQWLFENKYYDMALVEADAALKIDPDFRDARILRQLAERQIVWAIRPPPEPEGAGATTIPAGPFAAAADTTAKPAKSEARKLLTADQINTIRQSELRESDKVRISFAKNVQKRFIDGGGAQQADFNKLSDVAKAVAIIKSGQPDLTPDVKVQEDPATIAQFRKDVHPALASGCATTSCHGGAKGGTFYLFTATNDAAVYTNYYLLMRYSTEVDGKLRKAVERTQASSSLIVQYGTATAKATSPHPTVTGFNALSDQRLTQINAWLGSGLPSADPTYEFDIPVHVAVVAPPTNPGVVPPGPTTQPTEEPRVDVPPPPVPQQPQTPAPRPSTRPAPRPQPANGATPPPTGGQGVGDTLQNIRDNKIKLPPPIIQ